MVLVLFPSKKMADADAVAAEGTFLCGIGSLIVRLALLCL